jgi:hypothetical protein
MLIARPLLALSRRTLLTAVLSLLAASCLSAQGFFSQAPASPFNGKPLPRPDSIGTYHFLVGGNLVGSHANVASVYPAASLLAQLSRINANPVEMLLAAGPLMRDGSDPAQRQAIKQAFSGLRFPVYHAPGAGDLRDRSAYKVDFKATQHLFYYQEDCFLLLDAEALVEGRGQELLDFLDAYEKRKLFRKGLSTRNLFVLSSRHIFAPCVTGLDGIEGISNAPLPAGLDRDMACRIHERVLKFAGTAPVYWFSGDLGRRGKAAVYFAQAPGSRVRYIGTGIGDTGRDALIRVSVNKDGAVDLAMFPLTPQTWQPVSSYTLPAVQAELNGGSGSFKIPGNWLMLGFLFTLILIAVIAVRFFKDKPAAA